MSTHTVHHQTDLGIHFIQGLLPRSIFYEVILLNRLLDLMLWRWLGHNSWLQSLTGIGTVLIASVATHTLVIV